MSWNKRSQKYPERQYAHEVGTESYVCQANNNGHKCKIYENNGRN